MYPLDDKGAWGARGGVMSIKRTALWIVAASILLSWAGLAAIMVGLQGQNSSLANSASQTRIIADERLPLLIAIKDVKIDVIQVQQFLTDIAATRGMPGFDDGFTNAAHYAALFDTDTAKVRNLAQKIGAKEVLTSLDALEKAFRPYYSGGRKMAQKYIEQGPTGGNAEMAIFDADAKAMTEATDAAVASVEQATSLALHDLSMEATSLAEANTALIRHLLVIGLISAAVSGLGLLYLLRHLNRRFGALDHDIRAVMETSGTTDLVLDPSRQDEFGPVAKALTAFRDNLSGQSRLGREVRLLGELNEWLQSSKSLDELFYMVTRFLTHLLPDSAGSIYVYSNSRDVLDGASAWNGGVHRPHIHPEDCWGLRRGRTYSFAEGEVKFKCSHVHEGEATNYICIPFLAHGETVGLMHLEAHDHVTSEQFATQKKLAQMCAEQISLAIANVRMRDELHHQAIRDVLTGLYNRRHLMDTLRRRIETRRAEPFAIISIDVDYFKKFNDNHGHDAGDTVLRTIGETMNASVDGTEIACRMGGEELLILLPDATLEIAMARADALRETIAALKVRYAEKELPQITISVGVSQFPLHGTTPQDLIRAADEALYVAKDAGRNQVVAAGTGAKAFDPDSDAWRRDTQEIALEHLAKEVVSISMQN
jgi:diguanylate cyclase (GGDEF)-like protein